MEQIHQLILEIKEKIDIIERKIDLLSNKIRFTESNIPFHHLESSSQIHVPNETLFYVKPDRHYE